MADEDSGTAGNGSVAPSTEAQFSVLAQYIKDMSVENPNAPQVFQWEVQPSLDVQFNLNAQKIADELHEVAIKIEVTARSDNGVHFVVDLTYGGLFGARNVPEDALGPVLLIEAPRLLFPFARQVVSDAVSSTGFPPLLLEPIDFAAAYVAQAEAAQNQGGLPGATPQGNA
jgi:preprotein translocase subunit SecB